MSFARQIEASMTQVGEPAKTTRSLKEDLRPSGQERPGRDERLKRHFDRNTVPWWVVFSGIYFLESHLVAQRPFWYDELFTYYLSSMPISRLWQALLAGVDQNPPTFYLVSAAARRLATTPEVGLRIPAIFGTWVMFLAMFLYVRKRASATYAWLALLFVSSTTVLFYATEARPYGLVLGCCAMAFFAWSEAAQPKRPGWSIPLLGLSLVCAALSHAYAVLIWVPLGAGELWRAIRERRIDLPVCTTIVGALTVFAIYVPIQQAVHGLFKYTWSKPLWSRIPESYAYYFEPAWLLMLAMLFMGGAFYLLRPQGEPLESKVKAQHLDAPLPIHETVALTALALLPVFGTILGRLFTGIFTGRYTIETMIALGIMFAICCDRAMKSAAIPGLCLCLAPIAWGIANIVYLVTLPVTAPVGPPSHESRYLAEFDLLPVIEQSDLPVVISSGDRFLEFDHYASPELASRLHFLLDVNTAIQHTQVDLFDHGYPLMAQWFPLRGHLDQYRDFVAEHPHFLVYGNWDNEVVHDWLVYRLTSDHAQVSVLGRTDLAKNSPFRIKAQGGWRYLYLFEVTVKPRGE